MSTYQDFARQVLGWREAAILYGDTLPAIALREMGDANKWVELVYLNGLRHPYLVSNQAEQGAQRGTLKYGDMIRIPSARRVYTAVTDPASVYGQDVGVWQGRVRIENGDFAIVAGYDNLRQAIQSRLSTDPGEILRHPDYGSHVRAVLGEKYNAVIQMLAQAFVVEALEAEPRISRVSKASFDRDGDAIGLALEVLPITGQVPVTANLVFPAV